jgi:predicted aminopeptidase
MRVRYRRFVRLAGVPMSALRIGCVTALALLVGGCTLPYYWQAATGHLELVSKRVPIETVLTDPAEPDAVKRALSRVLEMRQFAVAELGLPDNDSYRSYVDIGRPYVVWNVVAAGEFSVDAKQWCFPLLGCVSYRGYFHRDAAEGFAADLAEAGLDTYVAGATAYSTLGYFADPVLSTMLAGGEAYVAGVLFHELAHQKFYLKGDSDLNEAFASAVQQYGTEAWLRAYGTADELDAYRRRQSRQADFSALIAAQRMRLAAIYESGAPAATLRAEKARAFAQMRQDYQRYKAAWGGVTDYDAWFDQPLNNAQLVSVATYRRWLPGLLWYLEHNGLDTLYERMDALAQLTDAQREEQLDAWQNAATEGGG